MKGDQKEHHHHHNHGPKFHHFKKGPLKCQKCGEEIQFKFERSKEGEPRKKPEPPKCQKRGAVWERMKPKCPFCQAELPKQISKNSINHQNLNLKKKKILLRAVHHLKKKMRKK